jgi:carbonic anhydrase/acetyltransferase-like protein (isoleucine patch superfamily)
MDVQAILLTGVPAESTTSAPNGFGNPEEFSAVPLVVLPVLGQPLIQRMADRLLKSGIDSVTVLNAADPSLPLMDEACRSDLNWKNVPLDQIWRAAQDVFNEMVQGGAEIVAVIRIGAYAEVDIDALLQFHFDHRNHTTQVATSDGLLDFFVLSGSRRNDAAFLLRNKLGKMRVATQPYVTDAYVNRLRTPAELRLLIVDSLLQKTCIRPIGEEVRPGIWVAPTAKIHRSVRLVAPCYVGAYARVRAGSLITRATSLEHHCMIDCGTVVEASTVLPLSYVGAGLDMMHSVAGFNRIASAKYGAQLEIDDTTLLSIVPATSALRTLSHAANLAMFLPRQIIRSFIGGRKMRPTQIGTECLPVDFNPSTAKHPASKDRQPALTPSVVAGMREYGNQ